MTYTISLPAATPPEEAEEFKEAATPRFGGTMVYVAIAVAAAGTRAVYYAKRSKSDKLSELAVVEYLKKRGRLSLPI